MTKWILAAGAAALAITSPALSQRGEREGGKGGQQAAQVQKGGGGKARASKASRAPRAANVQRGGGDRARASTTSRGGAPRAAKAPSVQRGGGNVRSSRIERGGNRDARSIQRFSGGNDRRSERAARVNRPVDRGNVRVRGDNRGSAQARVRDDNREGALARVRDENRGRAQIRGRDDDRFAGTRLGGDDRRGRDGRTDDVLRLRGERIDGDRRARAVRIGDDRRLRAARFDDDRRVVRVDNDRFLKVDNDRVVRIANGDRFDRRFAGLGLVDGCPPGLARKSNGCLPPGQARRAFGNDVLGLGAVIPATFAGSRFVPDYYRGYDRSRWSDYWRDDDDYYYRYGNGYVYRVDRDYGIVAGLIPLFGGGYGIGQPYPYGYGVYNVPYRYRSYYYDDDDCYYRYGGGGIYCVDRDTGLIAAIVALLAGGLSVGQPLPLGYDVYNVPYAYRARYYDTPDIWYRYNDGYVYGINPHTRIVQTVIVV